MFSFLFPAFVVTSDTIKFLHSTMPQCDDNNNDNDTDSDSDNDNENVIGCIETFLV